ncbi:MAG TPA: hypothetical protein VLI05_04725 [Candidatus Saccharimonadia bacterium]|nr:hypothetical protein [Candidatus Saccharimonadia bacterium]
MKLKTLLALSFLLILLIVIAVRFVPELWGSQDDLSTKSGTTLLVLAVFGALLLLYVGRRYLLGSERTGVDGKRRLLPPSNAELVVAVLLEALIVTFWTLLVLGQFVPALIVLAIMAAIWLIVALAQSQL